MTNNVEEPKPGEVYVHFKGFDYEIVAVSRDCNAPENKSVIYKSLYGAERYPAGTIWHRSLENFLEDVKVSGGITKRFRKIERSV